VLFDRSVVDHRSAQFDPSLQRETGRIIEVLVGELEIDRARLCDVEKPVAQHAHEPALNRIPALPTPSRDLAKLGDAKSARLKRRSCLKRLHHVVSRRTRRAWEQELSDQGLRRAPRAPGAIYIRKELMEPSQIIGLKRAQDRATDLLNSWAETLQARRDILPQRQAIRLAYLAAAAGHRSSRRHHLIQGCKRRQKMR
jgi:hypothetical protein